MKGGKEDNVLRKPSGQNVVFFPSLHPLLDTITILSFKRNFMVLLKGARPAVSQSDEWARSGQLYMFACGCKQCINTSHKTTRFWRGRDSSCTCRPNTVFRWVWTFQRGRLYLKPNTNSGKIASLQLHGMIFTKFITVTFTKAREGIWCKSQSFTRKSLRVGVFQN